MSTEDDWAAEQYRQQRRKSGCFVQLLPVAVLFALIRKGLKR